MINHIWLRFVKFQNEKIYYFSTQINHLLKISNPNTPYFCINFLNIFFFPKFRIPKYLKNLPQNLKQSIMSTLSKIFTDLEIFNPHFPNPLPFISTQSQKNHRSVFLPNNPQRSSIHHSSGAPDAPSGQHLLFLFLSSLFSFFLPPPLSIPSDE